MDRRTSIVIQKRRWRDGCGPRICISRFIVRCYTYVIYSLLFSGLNINLMQLLDRRGMKLKAVYIFLKMEAIGSVKI